jgi:imidazolonepropionase-like amidohydrolase
MGITETNTIFADMNYPDSDACVELINGRFFDVISGCYFDPGTSLIIRNSKIESVIKNDERNDNQRKPDFLIDLKGKTVLPGFFNTHCHINMTSPSWFPTVKDTFVWKLFQEKQKIKNMADCLAHGITNIRDSYSENLFDTQHLKNKIEQGKIPGPRIQQAVVVGPKGSYFAEEPSLKRRISRSMVGVSTIDHSRNEAGVIEFPVDADEQMIRDAVDRAIDERGADAIKIGEQLISTTSYKPDATIMTLNQLGALTDQAYKRGKKTIVHQITADTFRRAVATGVSSIAHLATDSILSQEDIEAFISAGCILEPTLSVQYDLSWKITGSRYCDHPDMERLMNFRDSVYTFNRIGKEFYLPELRDSLNIAYDKFKNCRFKVLGSIDLTKLYIFYAGMVNHGNANYRNLVHAGACISTSNDAGIPPCTPAMIELELALSDLILTASSEPVNYTGADHVRMSTINGARALGVEDDFGSIESGKIADLVVLDGNVLEEKGIIGNKVAALFMNGKAVINNCELKITKNA